MTNYRSVAGQLSVIVDDIINKVIPSLKNGTATNTSITNTSNKLKQAQAQINILQKSFESEAISLLKSIKSIPVRGKNFFNKSIFGGFKVKKYPTLYQMPLVLSLLKVDANQARNMNQKIANTKKINNNAKRAQNEIKKKESSITTLNQAARGIKAQIGNNTGLSNSRVNQIRNMSKSLVLLNK